MRVGFVGAGNMGLQLIRSLIRAGVEVIAYDLRAEAREQAAAAGASTVDAIEGVISGTDIIAVTVLDDAQLSGVLSGPDGLLIRMRPPQTVIVHSTVQPSTIEHIAAEATRTGIDIVDAPVAGAGVRASTGSLAVLVGGEIAAVERCRPALEAVGQIHHVGPVGAGQAIKLANNMVVATTKAVLYEAFQLGYAFGVKPEDVRAALLDGSAGSFLLENWAFFESLLTEHTLAGSPGFLDFMAKDVWSAVLAGHAKKLNMPVAAVAANTLGGKLAERIVAIRGESDAGLQAVMPARTL